MNRLIHTVVFSFILCFWGHSIAQDQVTNHYQSSINAEFSIGLAGHAKDYKYKSIGLATGYGKMVSNSSYIGIGVKPNYTFSNDDFKGFFLPIYGEYKYQPLSDAGVRGFGNVRLGYSPFSKKGLYAHIGGGIIIYQNWELCVGASYQFASFHETWFKETYKLDYHFVYTTLSVGYKF